MATDQITKTIDPGVYNIEYFSGAQVACYIGDILIDEITSISYQVSQQKRPLYGYADQYFRTVAKGQVLVQGQFTINFKEAGYLWVVLDHYNKVVRGLKGSLDYPLSENQSTGQIGDPSSPFASSDTVQRLNIERIIDGDTSIADRNQLLNQIAVAQTLTGFPGGGGNSSSNRLGQAENIFEAFEDSIWDKKNAKVDFGNEENRRPDDSKFDGFDIYIAYGDFAGDNRHNHTIRKISQISIIGQAQQVTIDGLPLQESYQFLARTIV